MLSVISYSPHKCYPLQLLSHYPSVLVLYPSFLAHPFFHPLLGLELMDRQARFTIHFDYLAKHFHLIFMKFTNQFLQAQQRFNFAEGIISQKNLLYKSALLVHCNVFLPGNL